MFYKSFFYNVLSDDDIKNLVLGLSKLINLNDLLLDFKNVSFLYKILIK